MEDLPAKVTTMGGEKKPDMTQHFIVLGGGIAGLTAGLELLKTGQRVTLIEKGTVVGGLARTFERDGFRFDIGGHRFHSNNPSVVAWVKELLKEDLLTVPRISHMHLEGKFVDYPLQFPQSLSVFSPSRAIQMGASYLMAKFQRDGRPDVSFEDWVVCRFGRAMYGVFIEPYTRKVWGILCSEISAQWASQRIGIPSMWGALKEVILPSKNLATAIKKFYYPRRGFGMIPDAIARDILARGGQLETETSLAGLMPEAAGFEVTVRHRNGLTKTLKADQIVSTIPLHFLLEAIPASLGSREVLEQYQLEYRDIICLFIALKKPQVSRDSWTYFPSDKLIFGRTHEPKNWSPEMVPGADCTSLAVEIFSSRGEEIWSWPDETILEKVVPQLEEIGWIGRRDIFKWWVVRVPFAYPVYRVGYEAKLQHISHYLAQWPNLHLLGRSGSFKYMNSDGVIEDVFRFMDEMFGLQAGTRQLSVEGGRWV